MSTEIDGESHGCIFQWKIVNVSHWWLTNGRCITNPAFIADALQGTKWNLCLYLTVEKSVCFYLVRSSDCSGPSVIDIQYRIDLMDENGDSLIASTQKPSRLEKGYRSTCKMLEGEKIFVTERQNFLPEDTLTIQCSIWKKEETLLKPKHVSARTVFKVNRRSLVWKIEEFSKLKPCVRNKFKDELVDFDLFFNEGLDFEKNLVMNCITIDESIKYFSIKTSIIDTKGKKEDCGTQEYFENYLKAGVLWTLLCTKQVLENKRRYLENDALTLDCECVYSTGTVLYEYCLSGIIPSEAKNVVGEKRNPIQKEKPQCTLVLANDLKSMYNNKDFSDTEFRTTTKTFAVHRNILSARSPMFKRMFNNDMRESNSGHIDIDDLEDDTVQRMLLYIYTDSLEDLQLENACKLYAAAYKYEILSLRGQCSSFLKDNLCPTKACDILALADRHQDEDLKNAVQDFIIRHDEVFGSQEWKQLMATNIHLAADVMYRKIYPG